MKGMVRRVNPEIVAGNQGDHRTEIVCPAVPHQDDGLTVVSQMTLGVDPGVQLSWVIDRSYWRRGFRLLGFHSTSGFAPDPRCREFSAHGQLFLEETADGSLDRRLPEGTHFFTFLVHKSFGWWEQIGGPVRFSESIPSARTAIGRIEDQARLCQLQEDYQLRSVRSEITAIEAEVALHRARQKLAELRAPKSEENWKSKVRKKVAADVGEKLEKATARIEYAAALKQALEELMSSPAWKKLSPDEQERLRDQVIRDFDAAEEFFQI